VIEQFLEKGMEIWAFLNAGRIQRFILQCMYIEQMIEQDGYQVETVSGIPSFCAAAARLKSATWRAGRSDPYFTGGLMRQEKVCSYREQRF